MEKEGSGKAVRQGEDQSQPASSSASTLRLGAGAPGAFPQVSLRSGRKANAGTMNENQSHSPPLARIHVRTHAPQQTVPPAKPSPAT